MQKNTTVEKQCDNCNLVLPISKFRSYKNRSESIGYRNSCIECEREQSRKRHQQKKAQLDVDNNEKAQLDVDNDEKPDLFRFMDQFKKVKRVG